MDTASIPRRSNMDSQGAQKQDSFRSLGAVLEESKLVDVVITTIIKSPLLCQLS
jgi:hypothetical protein